MAIVSDKRRKERNPSDHRGAAEGFGRHKKMNLAKRKAAGEALQQQMRERLGEELWETLEEREKMIDKMNKNQSGGILEPEKSGCRMSAKNLLEDKIIRLEREIAALQVLVDAIPWKILTSDDEERLWNYFIKR